MKGRRAKPTALHVVEGTFRKEPRERAAHEPKPAKGIGTAPTWLTAEQKTMWARLVRDSAPGVLKKSDRGSFERYVVLSCACAKIMRQFATEGSALMVADARNSATLNPLLRAMRQLSVELRHLETELGFTPASRSRIRVDDADGKKADPLSEFLDDGDDESAA